MMHSNYSNYGPLEDCNSQEQQQLNMSYSSSSNRTSPNRIQPCHHVRRLSLLVEMEDGSCHDLSNLSLKANAPQPKELFPSCESVRRDLPDIDDSHTMKLWEPLPRADPPFQRANTTTTCTLKENERISRTPAQRRKAIMSRRPSTTEDESPPLSAPVRSPQAQPQAQPTNAPSVPQMTSQSERWGSSPAPSPSPRPTPSPQPSRSRSPLPPSARPQMPAQIPSARPNEPGPRPKVNYKKLYGAGGGENKRDLRTSQRHISFQEQQLQRTLQEEERLRKEKEQQQGGQGGQPETVQEEEEPSPRPLDELSSSPPRPTQDSISSYGAPWQQTPSPREPQHLHQSRPREPQLPPLMSMSHNQYQNHQEKPSRTSPPPPPPPPHVHHAPSSHSRRTPSSCSAPSSGNSQTVMEIAPNLFVPYKGSHETWEAVQRGQFTVTTCFACTLQLVVIDTAEFLVCPDCHTVSPLSYSGDSRGVERCGVGLGIKREWCDTEAALPTGMQTNGGQTTTVFSEPTPIQPYPTTMMQQQHQSPPRPSRQTYEQRHQEKQAKYNERSSSPEQDNRYQTSQRRATFMI